MAKRGNGEGSVYKQRNGLWAASISVEGGKRKYFYGKTRKEVQEKLAAALQEQKQGMLVATPQQTVGQFLTDWLENTHKQSVRPRTYERYEEAIRLHLLPVLGKYRDSNSDRYCLASNHNSSTDLVPDYYCPLAGRNWRRDQC
jgi:integrase